MPIDQLADALFSYSVVVVAAAVVVPSRVTITILINDKQ